MPAPRGGRRALDLAGRLVRLGVPGQRADEVARLGLHRDGLAALASGPDPAAALDVATRLSRRAPSTWAVLRPSVEALRRLGVLAGASETAADLALTDPGILGLLTSPLDGPLDRGALQRAVGVALRGAVEPGRVLARWQRRGLVRVALRDLLGLASTPQVAAELSDLADAVLGAALDHVRARTRSDARLAVIAMGKLGGLELNYVSDVDVVFVAGEDVAAATRLAQAFLRLVGATVPEGRAYELDTTLRPEGRDGPLVRSLDGYRAYYERWSAAWESQALLKARPCAGDPELGAAFVELVRPVVWPDRRAAGAVAELQRLKGVVERSPKVRSSGSREVKLAPGGLRDVEFAVQLLQLVHGRADESLRVRDTLGGLAALAAGGYVGDDDARLLADAYVRLRTIEHRLQLRRLRRTHALPADDTDRRRLARTMGYRDDTDTTGLARFDADVRSLQAEVRRVHSALFYRPLLDRVAESAPLAGAGGLDVEAVRDRLVALGFHEPDRALQALDALAAGTGRRARLLRTLLPTLLDALAATPDPDRGLAALRSLTRRLDTSPQLLVALRDSPPVLGRIATVLGSSPVVGRWVERQPEVLPLFTDEAALQGGGDGSAARAGAAVRRLRDVADDAEATDVLARLVRRDVARTAIRDLLGLTGGDAVGAELTRTAEIALEAAAALVTPPGASLAVIGMGKLGGHEVSYASDLDVLVVVEPSEALPDGVRAAARLLRLLPAPLGMGRAFTVDANLRPEGKDGPLARSLASYRVYYERWAEAWELQALTQARPVAGDRALGRAFVDVLTSVVYPPVADARVLDGVRAVKRRLEAERRRSAGLDLKLSPGGLVDVEWTVQLLQLAAGGRHPSVRRRGTLPALRELEAAGLIDEADARVLRDGWSCCTALRRALALAGERDTSVLPEGEALQRAAPLAGLDPEVAADEIRTAMRDVRAVHERLFYAPSP